MGGANGLIVAFVVAVWAAYFVPLVLRRYDDASTSSSLESLSPLSRVIARRGASDAPEPEADVNDQTATADATPAATAQPASASDASRGETVQALSREALSRIEPPARPSVTGKAAAIAARRRRRTLLTLLTALLVVGGLAFFSVVAPVWVSAPAGLVVAWLVACRVQVRGERGISGSRRSLPRVRLPRVPMPKLSRPKRPRAARPQRAESSAASHEEDTVIVQLDDVEPDRSHVMEPAELHESALDDQVVIAVPSVSTAGEPLWDPLPVTVPTYVTKPRAGRTVRTIDFDAPGAWTSGHIEGEDVELPGRPAQAEAPRRASGQ
ncbi:hypothetical protein ACHAAC_01680 [Aeromicrobium sp. CF4.19]|uniref:divisome protein SepX/GlpR n=1 Tax=Aeromicrobium sp. CF4.19 TaxID=3373082 RepID=UPI003EE4B9B0